MTIFHKFSVYSIYFLFGYNMVVKQTGVVLKRGCGVYFSFRHIFFLFWDKYTVYPSPAEPRYTLSLQTV